MSCISPATARVDRISRTETCSDISNGAEPPARDATGHRRSVADAGTAVGGPTDAVRASRTGPGAGNRSDNVRIAVSDVPGEHPRRVRARPVPERMVPAQNNRRTAVIFASVGRLERDRSRTPLRREMARRGSIDGSKPTTAGGCRGGVDPLARRDGRPRRAGSGISEPRV